MKQRGFEIVTDYKDKGIHIPVRKTARSAAYDLEAAEDIVLPSFQKGMKPTLIPTGLKAYMEDDEVLLLVPRSSSPKKQGISFPHSIGVIDADYYNNVDNEGHIFVQCINLKEEDVTIKKGDTICQAIFQKFLITDDDRASGERVGGFGSTD
jgi:dUTP pyrophosphatase